MAADAPKRPQDLVGWNEAGKKPAKPQPDPSDLTGWSERKTTR